MMNYIRRSLYFVLFMIASVAGVSVAFDMISSKSDALVFFGLVIIGVIVAIYAFVITELPKSFRNGEK